MFGLSFSHLLLLSVIALVIIGPKQLPEVARVLGRFINDLKRTSGEMTRSFGEMRDTPNPSVWQNKTLHEPSAVSHEPVSYPEAPGSEVPHSEPALDEHDQMSFDITKDHADHGD